VTRSAKLRAFGNKVGQLYRSSWWSIELPPAWTYQLEPECVSFRNEPQFGVLQVSAARNPDESATLQDLYDFAADRNNSERNFQAMNTGKHSGIFAEYISEELFWAEWLLYSGPTVVYLTYNVRANLRDREITDVRRIVDSKSIYG
jgi:hypothetical protein